MKKVLVITYYWPPAGGPGVQRVLKFVKYLPNFGWEPLVLTVENPDAPVYDESLSLDIPPNRKVYKTTALEPFELYKKFTGKKADSNIPNDVLLNKKNVTLKDRFAKWVRLNLFIPDAKIGWKRYAVKRGLEIIKSERIDLIFTTSPPQTVALIGKKLSKFSGVKWIADFRDPWMEIVYYQNVNRSKFTRSIDSFLEKKVMRNAYSIVTISHDMARLFKEKAEEQKVIVIPNGFDESDFAENSIIKNDKFTISYTGTISKDRVPYPFIEALSKLIHQDGITNIEMNFAGNFSNEFYDEIEKQNISEYFNIQSFLPHNDSTKILQDSDVLLLVIDNVLDNKGILTGKLFEYMGCKKPIFAIGPVDGDAHQIIKETDCGVMVEYEDINSAYEQLQKMYISWKNDISVYKFEVEKYSRKNMTKKLTEVFEETIR